MADQIPKPGRVVAYRRDPDLEGPLRVCALMPLRDDWASASTLLPLLDKAIPRALCRLEVVIVDDGSIQPCKPERFPLSLSNISSVGVLRLQRNLGHQRAISIGLLHIKEAIDCDAVLVMDADGEDTPEGAAALIREFSALRSPEAVFAKRTRRSETRLFRCFYRIYKSIHRLLTGISVQVGNFSVLPRSYLDTLSVMPELWNHYAAAVFRSNLPRTMIPIPRGTRFHGQSQMRFVSLVTHGLSAIMVFADSVGVRLLIASVVASILVTFGIIAIASIRLFTDQAIPGWATYTTGALIIIGIQLLAMATNFTFFILSSRTNLGFVPIRDYHLFIAHVLQVWPND